MTESIDGKYGIDNTSGLIGMLSRDEIDITIGDLQQLEKRNLAATALVSLRQYW